MDDGFEARKDGTIVFQFDTDLVVELRRPQLGEYRLLVEAVETMRDEVRQITRPAVAAEINALDPESDADSVESDKIIDRVNDLLIEWYVLVFKTLGNSPLPEEDKLPAWLLNSSLAGQLVEHWQKVPSRRGVR